MFKDFNKIPPLCGPERFYNYGEFVIRNDYQEQTQN